MAPKINTAGSPPLEIHLPERLVQRIRELRESQKREIDNINRAYSDKISNMLVGFLAAQEDVGSAFYELTENDTKLMLANVP